MKKIGIVGGVGWPSTIEYYRTICEESQLYHIDKEYSGAVPMPEISIESLNMNFSINNRGSSDPNSWKVWDGYFNEALKRLEKSGVEIIGIASVTPHSRLDEISQGLNTKILSVYEAIGLHCHAFNIGKILVLGTMPTMTSTAFVSGLEPYGVAVTYPRSELLKNQVVDVIKSLYKSEIEGASTKINHLVMQCVPENELENTVICLACTELPLAFRDCSNQSHFEVAGIHYINSTILHAKSLFAACLR